MKSPRIRLLSLAAAVVITLMMTCSAFAGTSATLLLEEPYGRLGFFTATGHAAVYLSGICTDTPLVLRPCAPGETGVVISRYHGVGKYDWVAIPLIPYLYAVERPEDIPLFADPKMTAFLRDRYRRKHLEVIAPDVRNGETPGGNWYELIGSSYDRTIYGFEIETTRKQDLALIKKLNSSPNVSHFHTVTRNCADFVKDIINFYYPKALHRSLFADVGITTPKQMAKTMTGFSARHPEIQFSRTVIAQVPGSMSRSTTAHGVVESFFKSKKYIVPSAVASPIFAGCVAGVYFTTGAGHFEPARNANIFVAGREAELPVEREDIKAYQAQLKHYLAGAFPETSAKDAEKVWAKLQSKAQPALDSQGHPILEMQVGEKFVRVGASASNIMNGDAPPELVRQLLAARLGSELRHPSPHSIAESEVDRDWNLLQRTASERDSSFTSRSTSQDANPVHGNRESTGISRTPLP
ncbi:MAG TPA: hypothetical protein VJP02_08860 [Candidatus Sulfotelmatobacter sp.]|nr:hypothetical protein [Candidatus Sulfotelmatobacter sp.]